MFTITPIPGFRVEASKEEFDLLLKDLEKSFKAEIDNGDIRYRCVRAGDAKTQTYDFRTNDTIILEKLGTFLMKYQ